MQTQRDTATQRHLVVFHGETTSPDSLRLPCPPSLLEPSPFPPRPSVLPQMLWEGIYLFKVSVSYEIIGSLWAVLVSVGLIARPPDLKLLNKQEWQECIKHLMNERTNERMKE